MQSLLAMVCLALEKGESQDGATKLEEWLLVGGRKREGGRVGEKRRVKGRDTY